jgi:thiamine biosynthesis protein ThiS
VTLARPEAEGVAAPESRRSLGRLRVALNRRFVANLGEPPEHEGNGERRAIDPDSTLLEIVLSLHLDPERVAIEMNREIVKREKWAATKVGGAAEIEIVQFVGGG